MEILWDLHFINGSFRPFQQSGCRAVLNGVTIIAQPAHALPAGIVAANGKRGRLKAFLCISALIAWADYSALAATT